MGVFQHWADHDRVSHKVRAASIAMDRVRDCQELIPGLHVICHVFAFSLGRQMGTGGAPEC